MTDRERPDRRSILAAAGGIVLGAAGGVGGTLAGLSHDDAPRAVSPGEELMTEHGVLKRLLLAYRAASTQLGAGRTPPAGAVLDAAQIIADYVESYHEGLEEAYVFPRVRRDNRYADLVTTLLIQHDRGRHLTAAITRAAAANLGDPATRAVLRTCLDRFVVMYEPHEAWEDTVIYPALRAGTSQRTLDDLADRFAEYENTRYNGDALPVILDRVTGVEQQLHIDDLAAFTPPALR
jgi:hemerythrin-like domain-containing protein